MEKKIENFGGLFEHPVISVGDLGEIEHNKKTVIITKIENNEAGQKVSFRNLTIWEKIGRLVKVKFIFAWYDLFIGVFYDQKKNWIYILPFLILLLIFLHFS